MGRLSRASSVHFVPSRKEVSDTVIEVTVDDPVCSLSAAIVEVRRPAAPPGRSLSQDIQSAGIRLTVTGIDVKFECV
jgi:hypothetical protein